MEQSELFDAQVHAKKIYNLLLEILDLSRQLAEAADRQDQVTVQLLLSMRQEAVNRLEAADQLLRALRDRLRAGDGARLSQLLNGQPATAPAEQALAGQVADNKRLLQKVVQLDRQISLKIAGDDSVYRVNEGAHKK